MLNLNLEFCKIMMFDWFRLGKLAVIFVNCHPIAISCIRSLNTVESYPESENLIFSKSILMCSMSNKLVVYVGWYLLPKGNLSC